MFRCGFSNSSPPIMLYQLASPGRWRAVNPAPEIASVCPPDSSCTAIAVGAQWIEYDLLNCAPDDEHCTNNYVFQSLDNSRVEGDPSRPGGTEYPDLNSPTLAHKLCSPLRVPTTWTTVKETGSIAFYLKFAVEVGSTSSAYGAPAGSYHARCGSPLHEQLQSGPNEMPIAAPLTRWCGGMTTTPWPASSYRAGGASGSQYRPARPHPLRH
jgi:hypothetical protein